MKATNAPSNSPAPPIKSAARNPVVNARGAPCPVMRKDGAQHGDAERRADHARGVDEARRGARARRRHAGDRHRIHRAGVEAEADTDDRRATSIDDRGSRLRGTKRQHQQADAHRRHARRHRRARRRTRRERARAIARRRRRATDDGSNSSPAAKAEAPRALQIERHQEQHAVHAEGHQRRDGQRGGEGAAPTGSSGTSAPSVRASTARNSAPRHRDGETSRAIDAAVQPKRGPSIARKRQQRPAPRWRASGPADRVAALPDRAIPAARARSGRARAKANGTIIRKMLRQPAPLDQQAAEARADRQRDAIAARPDADRMGALGRIFIGHGEDRQRGRHQQRRAEPGQGAAGDQDDLVRREAANQRADGEDRDAEREDAAAAIKIGERSRRQQQARIDEIVGVDAPIAAR